MWRAWRRPCSTQFCFLPTQTCRSWSWRLRPALFRRSQLCRNGEVKHRATAQLRGHADGPAVRLDNRLRDGQSHAGALNAVALVAPAIKLLEDKGLLHVVDARTAVGDAQADHFPRRFC